MNDITELSRSAFPPSGWTFRQPQTGWEAPMPLANTFDTQVNNIIKHRLANPAVTVKFKLATDPTAVAAELEHYTRLRLGLPLPPPPGSFPAPSRLIPQNVAAAVAAVKKLAAGGALLLEWEVSGEAPVQTEVATERASICVQCPKNQQGDFTRWFTKPVSDMLKKKMERVHAMKLKTVHDDKLGVCAACECPLKLKIFCGIDLIHKHLTPTAKAELWEKCWIK